MNTLIPISPDLLKPAQNIEDVISICDPRRPLSSKQEFDAFYVDRGSTVRDEMRLQLQINDLKRGIPVKFLLTGHKGSGKSTELNYLCDEISSHYFIVKVGFGLRPDISHIDIIVKAAMALLTNATDQKVINRTAAQVTEATLNKFLIFIKDTVFGGLPYRENFEATSNLNVKINALGLEFEGKYEAEASSREKIRANAENKLHEYIAYINELSDKIQEAYGKKVLFVFEDTDKLDIDAAKQLFYNRTRALTEFFPSAIYLFPIGLRYATEFANIQQYFNNAYCLDNIKTHTRTGALYTEGWDILQKFVQNRIGPNLIMPSAEQKIIAASGGLIRSLIQLLSSAALSALAKGRYRIEDVDAERAITRLRGEFIARLKDEDYALLKERHESKRLSGNASIQDLLQSLALLEYANGGDPWCDVHPAVLPTVLERSKSKV